MPDRLARQENAFPARDRVESALLSLCSARHRALTRARVIGAASMCVPVLGGDAPDYEAEGTSWIQAAYPFLVTEFDPEADWAHLDPIAPEIAVPTEFRDAANPWFAVDASEPEAAIEALARLARARIRGRVLVTVVGPAGLVVVRCPSPAAAVEVMRPLVGSDPVPLGPAHLAVAAAGIELNELMLGPQPAGDDLDAPRIVAFYSQHRPRRTNLDGEETPAQLVAEISRPAEASVLPAVGRQVVVGAGALGNWFLLARLLDDFPSSGPIEIWDDDRAELSNLNRQPLLAKNGVGRPKTEVVAEELRTADPAGEYRAVFRRVASPGELAGHAALFVATPDNDEARLTVADAARSAGVPFGTAGSSGIGAQVVVVQAGRACLACVLPPASGADGRADSCHLVRNDAVVCTNMIAAGLLRAELARPRAANLRFTGRGGGANRLGRMISDPPCHHHVGVLTRV